MENMKYTVNSHYITELEVEFSICNFNRLRETDDRHITNDVMDSDSKIFRETQAKRTLRGPFSPFVPHAIKDKMTYFSLKENEDLNKIYAIDSIENLTSEEYAIHNIGHATQLIQIPGFNILTDPMYNDPHCFFYPARTASCPSLEQLPLIDFIIISHKQQNNADSHSLQDLSKKHEENGWPQPQVFVPKGDKQVFEKFGCKNIEEVEWYTKISVVKDVNGIIKKLNFISIPADQHSIKCAFDHHQPFVSGWIINPEEENVIFKYSGDTRSLSNEYQQAVDAVLLHGIKNKTKNEGKNYCNLEIPDIICLEPSGPNYTRFYMDVTHQSTSYSALLKFVEAENLSKLSGQSMENILQKLKTVMVCHNKFELGPDRFNEGLFVFKKLVQYLQMNEGDLNKELLKQKEKLTQDFDKQRLKTKLFFTSRPLLSTLPRYTSLLVHAKDFIITEITQMINKDMDKEKVIEYLLNNTIFAKIGERLNDNRISNMHIEIENIQKYRGKKSTRIIRILKQYSDPDVD